MRPERLHRAGIVVYALATLREAAIPLLAVFVVGGLGGGFDGRALLRGVAFAVAGTVFAALAGYVRWRTTTWWVGDDGSIHHRSGVISTKAVDIPLTRIQSLDLEQGPVQRLFGVQALHVQTGGGGARGEIVLDAVGPAVVRTLRDLLAERGARGAAGTGSAGAAGTGSASAAGSGSAGLAGTGTGSAGAAGTGSARAAGTGSADTAGTGSADAAGRGSAGAAETVDEGDGAAGPAAVRSPAIERRLARSRLFVAALTAGQFGVVLPVLALLGQLAENLFDPERGREALGLLPDRAVEWIAAVVVVALVAWLLSVAGTVVAFAGFTVSRDGDRLRIRRGLLALREATVPIERVRAVEVIEGVLRRPLGLASLRLEVIGHAAEPSAAQTLFPLLARTEVRPFLDALLPELADDPGGLEPPPRRALRRYALPPALAGLAVGAAGWALTAAGPWALLAVVPAAGYGAARYRAAGWRLAGGRLAVRSLLLARTTVLAPAANRESHGLAQTLLQRRGDLADLHVAFGKSTTARIRHLDAAVAGEAFRTVGQRRLTAVAVPRPADGG
jgi:putative membrane protein